MFLLIEIALDIDKSCLLGLNGSNDKQYISGVNQLCNQVKSDGIKESDICQGKCANS